MNAAITMTYHDVEKEILRLAWKYAKQHGGDFEEIQAEANLAFARAYRTYDPTKGTSFVTWLWHCVWNALRDNGRKLSKQKERQPHVSQLDTEEALQQTPNRREFNWKGMAGDLSDDAQLMLMLVMNPPLDIPLMMGHRARQNNNWWELQNAVTSLLLDIGWSGKRVMNSFSEIRGALV